MSDKNRVCSVENAGALDFGLRKLFHNPQNILKPFITKRMTILDVGCGPGFFSIEIAEMVSESGKVIAADIQDGMLQKINNKIRNTDIQKIISFHKCQNDKIGVVEKVDFVFVFYMLHEVPGQKKFLSEIKNLLKPKGKVFIVEPKFHVSKNDFKKSVELINKLGFKKIDEPKVFFSRAVILETI